MVEVTPNYNYSLVGYIITLLLYWNINFHFF